MSAKNGQDIHGQRKPIGAVYSYDRRQAGQLINMITQGGSGLEAAAARPRVVGGIHPPALVLDGKVEWSPERPTIYTRGENSIKIFLS